MPDESVNPEQNAPDLSQIKPPAISRHVASNDMLNYDPMDNEYNLRDDLETSSFPSIAQLPSSPAARLMEMAMVHGNSEALRLLDSYFIEFEMRRVPMDQIAKALDISVHMARKLYKGFRERQRRYIERLEVNDVLARSMNALDELGARLYRIGTTPEEQTRNRISALKAAADVEVKKLDALEKNRFYERKGYAGIQNDEKDASKKPQFLMNIMQNIFTGKEIEGDPFYKDMEASVLDAELAEDGNAPEEPII